MTGILSEPRLTQDQNRDTVIGPQRRESSCPASSLATCTHNNKELTEEAFTVPELTSAQLSEEFPGNEWLVADIYEKYKADKSSVDEKWAEIFARLEAAKSSVASQKSAPKQSAAPAESAQAKPAKPAAAAQQKTENSEHAAPSDEEAKPPQPKVRRAETSPLAITSEPSRAAQEQRAAQEEAQEDKEDEWVRLRGMP